VVGGCGRRVWWEGVVGGETVYSLHYVHIMRSKFISRKIIIYSSNFVLIKGISPWYKYTLLMYRGAGSLCLPPAVQGRWRHLVWPEPSQSQ